MWTVWIQTEVENYFGEMVYLCLCGYRKLNWRFVSCSKVYIIKIKSYTLCVRGLVYCFRV